MAARRTSSLLSARSDELICRVTMANIASLRLAWRAAQAREGAGIDLAGRIAEASAERISVEGLARTSRARPPEADLRIRRGGAGSARQPAQ